MRQIIEGRIDTRGDQGGCEFLLLALLELRLLYLRYLFLGNLISRLLVLQGLHKCLVIRKRT
jgi:hypothetical protein